MRSYQTSNAHCEYFSVSGCVKTHTSPKCRKYGSLIQYRSVSAQYDSALMIDNCAGIFYALGDCWSFHTAKTHCGSRAFWRAGDVCVAKEFGVAKHILH